MVELKKTSLIFYTILVVALLTACGVAPPTPSTLLLISSTTPSITPSPVPSLTPPVTPSSIPSVTSTITFTSTPDPCSFAQQEKIQVIVPWLFTALEPGNPPQFDRILIERNPAWADFHQYDHGEIRSAGVIFHEIAFGPELGTGVSPAVLLVTYGLDKNWELPVNGDLVSEVDYIRAALHQRENYWILGTVDRDQYPMMGNAATYALYHYFSGDWSRLEDWCQTYVQVFNESPLKELDK